MICRADAMHAILRRRAVWKITGVAPAPRAGAMSAAVARQYVFGYGSLAGLRGRPAQLRGHRRVWGVAMDNRETIAGYKYYRRRDGSRPEVFVAFLDIVEEPGAATAGLLVAVEDETALHALDARERNYDRIDVTAAVPDAPGTVWAYRGSAAGRERLRTGRRHGTAVADRQYVAAVRAAFALLGAEQDIDPGELPLLNLERVDLPPEPQA